MSGKQEKIQLWSRWCDQLMCTGVVVEPASVFIPIFTLNYVFWLGDSVQGERVSVLAWLLIVAVLGELIYERKTGKNTVVKWSESDQLTGTVV